MNGDWTTITITSWTQRNNTRIGCANGQNEWMEGASKKLGSIGKQIRNDSNDHSWWSQERLR